MRKKVIFLLLALMVIFIASGCEGEQKTIILANDVKHEAAMQENEIKKIINAGTNFLNEGKYDDAKNSFEKALSMDKANKGAYIEIKNKYMDKQRIDDAYYIIKLAIANNVDVDYMTELLKDIKSKLEVTKLDISVYQKNEYKLPDKIKAKINNEDKEVSVIWNNNSVDTSKLETVKYEGKIDQYDRSVELNLNILKKVEKIKKIGYISKVYEANDKRYLKIDEVEFFMNSSTNPRIAEEEAIKDGMGSIINSEHGHIEGGYYTRNKDNSLRTYEISPDAGISVCAFMLNTSYDNAAIQQKISYGKFKTLLQNYEHILYYIHLEDNIVVKIEQQYIP